LTKAAEKAAEKVAYEKRVKDALAEAHKAAEDAYLAFKSTAKKAPEGHILDSCGGASVIIYKPSHRFRTTLSGMDAISRGYKGAWTVGGFTRSVNDQSITASEHACDAAAKVLEKHFPEEPTFYMRSYID
jgi:hypothetical protein